MKLVILSGGVDSSTCLALAKKNGDDAVALSFFYGQKHHEAELLASKKIAEHYNAKHICLDLSKIFENSSSSLKAGSNLAIPKVAYKDQTDLTTEIEFRNGVFISIATSIAMQHGADEIYYGAHSDDDGAVYPDCSEEFIGYLERLVDIGTKGMVKLTTPFKGENKGEVVRVGKELGVPYELTYSCYEGTIPACGKCGTCIDRAKAFKENNINIK